LLGRLPAMPQPQEGMARVRRRCHAAMLLRAKRRARAERRASRPARLPEAILVMSIGLYLAAAVAEAVRVVGSL
jgi:hypothetical protein